MEKLTIKNFGPISNLDLEVRKFTILIGEQATGKSTVAKLLSILKDAVVALGLVSVESRLRQFGLHQYFQKTTSIKYDCPDYSITCTSLSKVVIKAKSREFKEGQSQIKPLKKVLLTAGLNGSSFLSDSMMQQGVNTSIYVPAERILISSITASPFDYLNPDIQLPEYLTTFGKLFQETRRDLSELSVEWLNVKYSFSDNRNWITFRGRKIPMEHSATGFQIIVPLLLALEKSFKIPKAAVSYFIEEPEISLYPTAQYDLVKHLVDKCHSQSTRLFITTHSPYILSAFNNLIFAGTIGKKNARGADKIVPKKYWIPGEEISVLRLDKKGIARDIIDPEIQQIAVENIDDVSRQINLEYDTLFKISASKK